MDENHCQSNFSKKIKGIKYKFTQKWACVGFFSFLKREALD